MASLPQALDEALRAHYSVRTRLRSEPGTARGFKARMRALERAHGTKKGAAAAAGIDPTTWSRWISGKQKWGPASVAKVDAAYLSVSRAARVTAGDTPMLFTIHAIVVCDSKPSKKNPSGKKYRNARNSGSHRNNGPQDSGYRPFRADRLTLSQRGQIVTAWAAGKSRDDVADILTNLIDHQYPEKFVFEGHNVIVELT